MRVRSVHLRGCPSKLILLLLTLVLELPAVAAAENWDWSLRAGLDYDFISHDYYLRTIDTLGLTPDSLLELKSTSDRIAEHGALIRFDLKNKSALNLNLSNRYYLTNEKTRAVVEMDVGWQALSFRTDTEFKRYNDSEDFSLYQSQLRSSNRIGLDLVSTDDYSLDLSQEVEYVGFDKAEPGITGYVQSESQVRFRRGIARFADLDLSLRFDLRNNYDSSDLDFRRTVLDLGFSSVGASGYFSSGVYFERRNYSLPDSENDFTYLSPTLDWDRYLTQSLSLAPRAELHYYRYDAESYATFSNLTLRAEAMFKYHYHLLSSFGVGFGFESFTAADSLYSGQDYRSFALLIGFESFSSDWLTVTVDSELGRRNYTSSDESFYTDYDFVSLDLLLDLEITGSLRLSLIGGTDFEYHSLKDDDIFVYLLSSSLTYKIK